MTHTVRIITSASATIWHILGFGQFTHGIYVSELDSISFSGSCLDIAILMQVDVNCKPSQFSYPPPTTSEASTQASKVPRAVLSTTNRAKQKAKQKQAAKESSKAGAAASDAGERSPKYAELDLPGLYLWLVSQRIA